MLNQSINWFLQVMENWRKSGNLIGGGTSGKCTVICTNVKSLQVKTYVVCEKFYLNRRFFFLVFSMQSVQF